MINFYPDSSQTREREVLTDEYIRTTANLAAKGLKLDLTFEISQNLWITSLPKGDFTRLIVNLIRNAAEAMSGRDMGKLKIIADNQTVLPNNSQKLKPGKYICIKVQDRGAGIERETLQHLFTPYYTSKPNGKGLGLWNCKNILKSVGWTIQVAGTSDQGTTMEIFIPVNNSGENR